MKDSAEFRSWRSKGDGLRDYSQLHSDDLFYVRHSHHLFCRTFISVQQHHLCIKIYGRRVVWSRVSTISGAGEDICTVGQSPIHDGTAKDSGLYWAWINMDAGCSREFVSRAVYIVKCRFPLGFSIVIYDNFYTVPHVNPTNALNPPNVHSLPSPNLFPHLLLNAFPSPPSSSSPSQLPSQTSTARPTPQ